MLPTEGPAAVATTCLESKSAIRSSAREMSIGLGLLACLAAYFGLHVVTRSLLSSNLQLDEAEQFILTQDWRLGYGSQPPLYTWIQKAFFVLMGANVTSLSLLKNAVLAGAYGFTFLAAREILSNARLAVLATASLLFFPQIAWEAQRDQSHLVMATAFSAATLFIFVRLLKEPNWRWHAALGATAGLGFLSKYNYLLLITALFAAAVTISRLRKSVLNGRVFIAAVMFLFIAGPHIGWMIEHKEAVASQAYKFEMVPSPTSASYYTGSVQLFNAIVGLIGIPLLIFLPLLVRRWRNSGSEITNDFLTLLTRSFLIGSALAAAMTYIFAVTYLRDRWLQPLFFSLPIVLVGMAAPQLSDRYIRNLFRFAAAIAVTVLVAINATALGANSLHRAHNLNIPYSTLAQELRKAGFHQGTIIANGFLLAGNLKNQFPASRVLARESASTSIPQAPILIVWPMRGNDLPEDFLKFACHKIGVGRNELQPAYIEAPCHNGPRQSEKFGYALFNPPREVGSVYR
jgi:4-amino-4-deoxy-L-arabinose transferase-like glycosyltransferase